MSDVIESTRRRFDLTAKLGPLPVWGWGLIVAVVSLAIYFLYKRTTGSGVIASTTVGGVADVNPGGSNYETSGFSGQNGTDTATTPDNNQAWLSRVSRTVADTLGASPTDVYAGIQRWLYGEDISPQDQKYADAAVRLGMNPPEGTQGTSSVVLSSRDMAIQSLNRVFGGSFTDKTAKLVDPTSSLDTAVTTWSRRLDAGASQADIEAAMRSGATYQKYLTQSRAAVRPSQYQTAVSAGA